MLIPSLQETFQQGEILLTELAGSQYTQKLPLAFNASIGEHYRHALEHAIMVIDICRNPWSGIVLDYDQRARDVEIETNLVVALKKTREAIQICDEIHPSALEQPVLLRGKTSYRMDSISVEVSSHLGREVMFIISHTIHHYATISLMCGIMEIPLPRGFGVAPSTLKHQDSIIKNP